MVALRVGLEGFQTLFVIYYGWYNGGYNEFGIKELKNEVIKKM
jgi:hypothetical protein